MNRVNFSQAGSAFWIILIAIAIFAALSFIMMQEGRSSASNLTQDQAKLAAQEIISYSDSVAQGWQALRLRGCSDTQISAETTTFFAGSNYVNPFAPTDKSCHLYQATGAALNLPSMNSQWVTVTPQTYWRFTPYDNVAGVGTSNTDMVFYFFALNKNICLKINELLGITNPSNEPPVLNLFYDDARWQGVYSATPTNLTHTNINGKSAFCLKLSADNIYRYVRVIEAR